MRIQSIIRVTPGKYEVRVFMDEPEGFEYQQIGISDIEVEIIRSQDLPMVELAKVLLQNTKVVAVEIIGWDKNGIRIER